MQNKNQYAIQGHSRSPILVPLPKLVINTNLHLSRTVSKLLQIIGQIFAFKVNP